MSKWPRTSGQSGDMRLFRDKKGTHLAVMMGHPDNPLGKVKSIVLEIVNGNRGVVCDLPVSWFSNTEKYGLTRVSWEELPVGPKVLLEEILEKSGVNPAQVPSFHRLAA